MRLIIIRPWYGIAAGDPDSGDTRVAEDDAEEGQASIAWRGRDNAAEDQPSVAAEVLDDRAGFSVSILIAWPAPIR